MATNDDGERILRYGLLPSKARIDSGAVTILSVHRTGSRGLAILRDDERGGMFFVAILFFESDAGELKSVGHVYSFPHDGLYSLFKMLRVAQDATPA